MASKKFCTQCGVSILATTFDKNNRRCIPCTTGLREEWAAAARRGPPTIKFAPNDEIEALRPFVDEFWANVLGTPYATSFVSNECTLEAWEHYVGGRERLVALVEQKYGVDISSHYEEPIPRVLRRIRDRAV